MQCGYVGDIGDYFKLGILRGLQDSYRIGMAWWLFTDPKYRDHLSSCPTAEQLLIFDNDHVQRRHVKNNFIGIKDGRHISYTVKPHEWRNFDPELFDYLKSIIDKKERCIQGLENKKILHCAVFASAAIPIFSNGHQRRSSQDTWLENVKAQLKSCNLIFIDPDNGLEPNNPREGKSVRYEELRRLRSQGRILIVYHHHTRFKGGHFSEIQALGKRLREEGFPVVDALRANAYSPRAFFILDADRNFRERIGGIMQQWKGKLTWHPNCDIT